MHHFDETLDYSIIIPARYESSRFPGKPLAIIHGKALLQHVWESCTKAVGKAKVFIATDDERIKSKAEEFGARVVMTSKNCLTGTDRVAEAASLLGIEHVVNVQGDEPLINPNDINHLITQHKIKPHSIINAACKIRSEEEYQSLTVPKVVFSNNDGSLFYMSRAAIPHNKTSTFNWGYKQVCIYIFNNEHLKMFAAQKSKGRLEAEEDIEILRFLEMGYKVQIIEVETGSAAVDRPEDIIVVERLMNDR